MLRVVDRWTMRIRVTYPYVRNLSAHVCMYVLTLIRESVRYPSKLHVNSLIRALAAPPRYGIAG